MLIRYPILSQHARIGMTAPSSGVRLSLHKELRRGIRRLEQQGFSVYCGDTVWTQHKAKSAPAAIRAKELNELLVREDIELVMPPWGGELLIEVLPLIDWEKIQPKWVMGYSDISLLLLAITLITGIATAHGPIMMDLRGDVTDKSTAGWMALLQTKAGEQVVQYSSELYQLNWPSESSSKSVYQLTEPTIWKTVNDVDVHVTGRLLGGCIDVIRHLIGTPYGDVRAFQAIQLQGERIVWFLENCELNTADLRRSLVHMKLAGWFEHCSAIMFGRSNGINVIQDYSEQDIYEELAEELNIPIVYDIDCGHVPPQITLINGAYAEIEVKGGKGLVKQTFKS